MRNQISDHLADIRTHNSRGVGHVRAKMQELRKSADELQARLEEACRQYEDMCAKTKPAMDSWNALNVGPERMALPKLPADRFSSPETNALISELEEELEWLPDENDHAHVDIDDLADSIQEGPIHGNSLALMSAAAEVGNDDDVRGAMRILERIEAHKIRMDVIDKTFTMCGFVNMLLKKNVPDEPEEVLQKQIFQTVQKMRKIWKGLEQKSGSKELMMQISKRDNAILWVPRAALEVKIIGQVLARQQQTVSPTEMAYRINLVKECLEWAGSQNSFGPRVIVVKPGNLEDLLRSVLGREDE